MNKENSIILYSSAYSSDNGCVLGNCKLEEYCLRSSAGTESIPPPPRSAASLVNNNLPIVESSFFLQHKIKKVTGTLSETLL